MCVKSQLGNSLEDVDSVFDLSEEQGNKSGVSRSFFQGIGRSITETMPDRNFNIPPHLVKTEIWIGLTGLYDADYIVVLDGIGVDVNMMGTVSSSMNNVSGYIRDSRSCYLKKPMFVSIREVSDDAQKRRQDWMGSIEGLKVSESVPKFGLQSGELLVEGFSELVGVINDDESKPLLIAGRSVYRRNLAKGVNEMIENGPEIVDTVTDNQRPTNGIGRWPNSEHPHPYSCHLRASLEKGFITAAVEPSIDFCVNRLEVLFSAV
jgi:hypothetical protein